MVPTLTTSITHEILETTAPHILTLFVKAKLLHFPDERTKNAITGDNEVLQPTPKGVAILQRFCEKLGLLSSPDRIPDILNSNLNTMDLICFERNPMTDRILHNSYWDKLLFIQMMGPRMNFWSPKNPPDEVPENTIRRIVENNTVSQLGAFPVYAYDYVTGNGREDKHRDTFFEFLRKGSSAASFGGNLVTPQGSIGSSKKEETTTSKKYPFFHRYFANPDSDSHVQYYVSNRGIRLFKDKIVEGHDKPINYCFSGKAMLQYLMDCTDLMYREEAIGVGDSFAKLGLMERISANPQRGNVSDSRHDLYMLSEKGEQISKWGNDGNGESSEDISLISMPLGRKGGSESEQEEEEDDRYLNPGISQCGESNVIRVPLKAVLHDPALKYLFRQHLCQTYCSENLDAYEAISEFQTKFQLLRKMVRMRKAEKMKADQDIANTLSPTTVQRRRLTIRTAIDRLSKECLSRVYTIYSSYLIDGAINDLNIDSKLRSSIQKIVNSNNPEQSVQCNWMHELGDDKSENRPPEPPSSGSSTGPPPAITIKGRQAILKPAELSPSDYLTEPTLQTLKQIMKHYSKVRKQVYSMMEQDSLPKFLNSSKFKESANALEEK
ncbi:hypothetical protein FOA43_001489 [Brettanomyces nanus]|uniref:Uncharacterized protein n=1 Tax=Eeniella nana TaxID=13502 RepID=A0A875S1E9_EENNA|nr:uncharacterized protein FOA43_001489 [Brettanomyces nanus]QPG74165.1 hypothetical protein FOA43_001489 [Brettanomyces nanus]